MELLRQQSPVSTVLLGENIDVRWRLVSPGLFMLMFENSMKNIKHTPSWSGTV